ncbi:MAG: flagellar hook-length control protein FliK [Panacagrimonas sp.]|nr:flagellar hook-length control protein FliK [Panacagrimonas sp.]MCC2657278.1 flagellar hook-length control protein FliK [Panacagrimonas sp.]
MANPDLIGAMPKPPAASPGPPPAGPIRPTPIANAGGVAAAARAFASPDFASDLAHLVALLAVGEADAPSPIAAAEDGIDSGDPADAVEALCAVVALAVPAVAPPCAVPVPSGDDVVTDARTPSRTLQVLLTPPGGIVAAGHRSANAPDAPTMPTLLRPAAAAHGAAAFTVVPDAASESGTAAAVSGSTSAPDATALFALPVSPETVARSAPHAVAATVVDILQPQAARQMAETITWHVPAQGVAEVQIRLNPEELGPVEVKLKLDGDKVSVRFDLADERVRDVVQSSLPSLSSMLSARGLQLDQAQVFAQSRGQGSPQQPSQAPWSSVAREGSDAELSISAVPRPLIRRGLLDDYA